MSMELVHNRCLFTDKQMIRLQVGGDVGCVGDGGAVIGRFPTRRTAERCFFNRCRRNPTPRARARVRPVVTSLWASSAFSGSLRIRTSRCFPTDGVHASVYEYGSLARVPFHSVTYGISQHKRHFWDIYGSVRGCTLAGFC